MRKFIAAAKIQASFAGEIRTFGFASGPYFADASGLVNRTWYPILQTDISVSVDLALPWDSGSSTQSIGDIRLINGGDAEFEYVLDQFIAAQVSGLPAQMRRGWDDQSWDDLADRIFVSKSDGKRFDGEELIIAQRHALDAIEQPIATEVFDEDTPNPRMVNQTVPLLLGPAFQIEPLIWDAAREVYYVAKNVHKIREVREGGLNTDNFTPQPFGFQMTSGASLQLTADAIGPAPEVESETLVVDWTFDAWTSDDPDGIDVDETPGEATISEATGGGAADIVVLDSAAGDTGLVSFTDPFLFAPFGVASAGDWTASTGTVPDAIIADDGTTFAEVSTIGQERLAIQGVDPAIPDGSVVTGVELEVIAEGTNAQWTQLTVIDTQGFQIAAFINSGEIADAIPTSKTTITGGGANYLTSATEVGSGDVNGGIGIALEVAQISPGSPAEVQIHQIRIKLHHVTEVKTVRLTTETGVLTVGRKCRLEITTTAADIFARWGNTGGTAGNPLTALSDPFAISQARLEGEGVRNFEFTAEDSYFAIEFFRSISAGTATVSRIRVFQRDDGLDRYKSLVPYISGLVGLDESSIDQAAIDAHDAATGSPEIGWYITGNESMAEWLDLTARRSLSGTWWVGRDGKLRSMLWSLPPGATPDYRIENIEVDGRRQSIRILGQATLQSDPAPRATERAVGAKNWRPLRVSETAGITDTFTEQERANVIEDWRVRRRADFDSLNPWTVA